MNIMIASDIHGYEKYCGELIEAFKRERAERMLLLGDLTDGNQKAADMLNRIKDSLFCVRGNCDHEEDQRMLDFPIMAHYCLMFIRGKIILATHGHKYGRNNPPKADILLQGHTHIPSWDKLEGGILCFNPGSVSLPRGGSKRGYMVMNENVVLWKYLNGEVYHSERL